MKFQNSQIKAPEGSQLTSQTILVDVLLHLGDPFPSPHDHGKFVAQSGRQMGTCFSWRRHNNIPGNLSSFIETRIIKTTDDAGVEAVLLRLQDPSQDLSLIDSLVEMVFHMVGPLGDAPHLKVCLLIQERLQIIPDLLIHRIIGYRFQIQKFSSFHQKPSLIQIILNKHFDKTGEKSI